MDYLRACYRVQMRLVADSDELFWVRWYWAPPKAKIFPEYHRTASEVWRTDHSLPCDGIGEANLDRAWRAGTSPNDFCGKRYVGDAEWFVSGIPLEAMSKPPPPPAKCCKCRKPGGTQSGGAGRGVVRMFVCDCDCSGSNGPPTVSVYTPQFGWVTCQRDPTFGARWKNPPDPQPGGTHWVFTVTWQACRWHVDLSLFDPTVPAAATWDSALVDDCCGTITGNYTGPPGTAWPSTVPIRRECAGFAGGRGTGGTKSGGAGLVGRQYATGGGGTEGGGTGTHGFSHGSAGGGTQAAGIGRSGRGYRGSGGTLDAGGGTGGGHYIGTGGTGAAGGNGFVEVEFMIPQLSQAVAASLATSATTVTATLASAPTAGHTLIAIVGSTGRGGNSISQTGVTWTRVSTANDGTAWVEIWLGAVGAGAGTSITWTGTGSNVQAIGVGEIPDSVTTVTQSNSQTGNAQTFGTGLIPTTAGQYVVYATCGSNAGFALVDATLEGVRLITPNVGEVNGGISRSPGGYVGFWGLFPSANHFAATILALS